MVSWLYETRRYISRYDVREQYKLIFGTEPKGIPSVEELEVVFKEQEERDVRITVKIVSHHFDESCIKGYLDSEVTKDFGIALAIEFRKMEEIIELADSSDLFLYMTEYPLTVEELSLVAKRGILKELAQRLIEKNKVMYTTLQGNFEQLLKLDDCNVVDENFIRGYIEHANYYSGNPLLQYILEQFPDSHPLFEDMDSLAWDPFTMSRRFSHWLTVSRRMDELSKYYLTLDHVGERFSKNSNFIKNYLRFKEVYPR
ncbi:hypothetical protein C9E85_15650 [Plesiomonas shigelloides]|nr:hypothetical protein C9E85_15650 [Plesiomonas shigelloides]